MPFQFITVSKDATLKKSSRNLYRSLLNKLAKEGYSTVQELIDNSKEVLEYITTQYKTKRERRVILSAIFYILVDTEYIKTKNPYYVYFQEQKEITLLEQNE